MSTPLLGLRPLAHVHSTPTHSERQTSTENELLRGNSTLHVLLGFASSGVHRRSCVLRLLLPVSPCRPDRVLLWTQAPLQQFVLLRALRSLCNELLCHDFTASVPSTTLLPSLPHELSPIAVAAPSVLSAAAALHPLILAVLWYTPCAVLQLLFGIPALSSLLVSVCDTCTCLPTHPLSLLLQPILGGKAQTALCEILYRQAQPRKQKGMKGSRFTAPSRGRWGHSSFRSFQSFFQRSCWAFHVRFPQRLSH